MEHAPGERLRPSTPRSWPQFGGLTRGELTGDLLFGTAEGFASPRIAELLDYWRAKAALKGLPARADIKPPEIRRLLPHLALIDILAHSHYRFRLAGTDLVRIWGLDPTGFEPEEVSDSAGATALRRVFRMAQRQRVPIAVRGRLNLSQQESRNFEALVAPLAADGCHVDMLMAGAVFS